MHCVSLCSSSGVAATVWDFQRWQLKPCLLMIQNACTSVYRDVTESTREYTKQQTSREPESPDQTLCHLRAALGSAFVQCCFTSTEALRTIQGRVASRKQDVHLLLHTAPELCSSLFDWWIQCCFTAPERCSGLFDWLIQCCFTSTETTGRNNNNNNR